jgi:LysM repeat protein
MDAINFHLSRLEKGEVTADEVEEYINEDDFQELLEEDDKLRDWFEMNHVTKTRKVEGKTVTTYEPIVANRITVPINKDYILKTDIIDQETGETITLEGVPNARHSRYQVKNEFRTIPIGESWDQYVGTYVDNKGNYLPRVYDPGNKNSAKDNRFMNQRFFDLKRSNNAEYRLLEEMKKFHLGVQKGQSNYSRLYLDMPRFAVKAGDFYQAAQRGKIGDRFNNWKEWKDQLIGKSVSDFENGYNYDAKNNLVNTDLKGNEITYVPVEGIYNLELGKTDADILTGLFRYGMSIRTQGKLLESLPIVESIVSTLEDPANQPKNMDAYSKGIFNVRNLYQNPTLKGAENNRLGQVRSLIEREYRGKQTASFEEANPRLSKYLDMIQGLSTRASLAVNIPSDLKNQFSGYIQSMIESIGGEFITSKDYALAAPWSTQAMLTWASKDAYAVGPGSLSGQMLQRFDPTFTSEDKFGNSISKSVVKDLANGSWMYAHRKFGEMDVAVKLFGAFLHGQKINQLVGGKQVSIRYVDAFELDKDGLMKLKPGVDAAWDTKSVFHTYVKGESLKQIADRYNITVEELKKRNNIESEIQFEEGQEIIIAKSEKFKAFKNKLQGTSRRLFGAYDRFGQAEGNKFIAYRMFFFMRKWFTPMLTNRWGFDSKTGGVSSGGERYDWALGRYTKGYYVSAFQTLVRILKSKGAEMSYMTDQEKADLKRTMAEGMMIIVASLLAAMLFGFDPDDDDKWKKIKARSGAINEESFNTYGFLSNHMLLLLLGVQAETSAFVPLPKIFGVNLGADDYTKMLTSTSASWYNTVVLYVQIMGDVFNFITFDDAARYEKDQGPYWWQQKDSLKIWKRLFSVFGFTGGTGDPTTVLKNFQNSSSRYGG